MLPAISQICTLHTPFEQDVQELAASHGATLEIWWTKLEEYLKTHSPGAVRQLLSEHGLETPVASLQGGLLASLGEPRRAHWDHFTRRLELCAPLGIETVIVACDLVGPLSQSMLDQVAASLTQLALAAGQRGVRVALEFQKSAAFANNLQTAAAMVAETGSPHLGLCLDAFHFFTGPSKLSDLGYLTGKNLFHVQLCDVAGVPRELAADRDRILPGDGDFDLEPLMARLRQIGYAGCVSLEVMNPRLWQVPAAQLFAIGLAALQKNFDPAK